MFIMTNINDYPSASSNISSLERKATIASELLSITGAINWGLVGIFDFNLVHSLFYFSPSLERGIYGIVGISGLYILFQLGKRLACRS